jgi:hypothetical protein
LLLDRWITFAAMNSARVGRRSIELDRAPKQHRNRDPQHISQVRALWFDHGAAARARAAIAITRRSSPLAGSAIAR